MAFQQPTDNPVKHRFNDFGKYRIEISKWRTEIRDILNIKYLYTFMHDYLVEEGWAPGDDSIFPETYYTMRDFPNYGKEVWIRWRLSRKPEGFPGDFFKYYMDLNWKIIGLKSTEIVVKGQKVKTDRGEFELECTGSLVLDEANAWKGWLGNFKKLLVTRIWRHRVRMHKKAVYDDMFKLRDLLMDYLEQVTYLPLKEGGDFYGKARPE